MATGKGIFSTKPRLKSVYDFLGLVNLFNCVFVLSPALHNIFHTPMVQYSLYVLKVLLNTNQSKQTTKSAT